MLKDSSTLLGHEEVKKLVILRMNEDFMIFMRKHYGNVVAHAFGAAAAHSVSALPA